MIKWIKNPIGLTIDPIILPDCGTKYTCLWGFSCPGTETGFNSCGVAEGFACSSDAFIK